MTRLEGKVAFITGGGRGQGRSHAVRLASEGADIIVIDICHNIEVNGYDLASPEDLKETERLIEAQDRRVVAAQADVRNYAQLKTVLADAVAQLGRLDIVVANAGIAPMGLDESDDELADAVFREGVNVNLVGVWNTCRASIPHIKAGGRGGAMVLTSSTAGLVGGHYGWSSGTVGYCAAKHGVVGIMRTLANALASESIRVNSIHPTGVNTAMISNPIMLEWLRNSVDAGASALGNPLPVDVLEPEDISNTVAFLASDEARYITGVTLPVDAGFCNK